MRSYPGPKRVYNKPGVLVGSIVGMLQLACMEIGERADERPAGEVECCKAEKARQIRALGRGEGSSGVHCFTAPIWICVRVLQSPRMDAPFDRWP